MLELCARVCVCKSKKVLENEGVWSTMGGNEESNEAGFFLE